MAVSLKYAVIERERRFLVRSIPNEDCRPVHRGKQAPAAGSSRRGRPGCPHSGHKARLGDGFSEIACTSIYLDDAEWRLLSQLPARVLHKRRHHVERGGVHVAIDQFEDGTLLAEIDDGDRSPEPVPSWLEVVADVTADESWTGGSLAANKGELTAGDERIANQS